MKIKSSLNNSIAETLYIPLLMKSRQTNAKNAFFKDTKAGEILGKIDYDFSNFGKSTLSSLSVAIRAKYFDDLTRHFITTNKNPIVVNIGCGLDTRYDRVGKESAQAIWYELDLPEVIKLREQLIAKPANSNYLPYSMLDINWMEEVKEKHFTGNFLFILEGVLMYFDKEDQVYFFQELAKKFPHSDLNFDVINKWMSKNSHRHNTAKKTNASFKFGVDNDQEFENWTTHLKHQDTKLFTDFKEWKRAGFFSFFMSIIPKLKYSGRMLHYKIL
jgi:O-methyltransferase involved in polyketide biosynthesis